MTIATNKPHWTEPHTERKNDRGQNEFFIAAFAWSTNQRRKHCKNNNKSGKMYIVTQK